MKSQTAFSKKDLVVALASVLFVMMNIGAINGTGRRRAKEMVCLSNLRQWGAMFEMFTNDNDGYFNRGWDAGETDLWMNALRPYYKNNLAFLLCPETTKMSNSPGTFIAWHRDVYERGSQSSVGSYGINAWTNNTDGIDWHWKNVRGVKSKNNIPVFLDSLWFDALPRHVDAPPVYSGEWAMISEMSHFCINRHNGGVNSLFMDWSARKIGLKELWTLKWHRSFDTAGPYTKAGGVWPSDWPEWMRNFKEY